MPICNPYLPLDEYIPDAESHVFGEIVFHESREWQVLEVTHYLPKEESMLLIEYIGIGHIDVLQLNWL